MDAESRRSLSNLSGYLPSAAAELMRGNPFFETPQGFEFFSCARAAFAAVSKEIKAERGGKVPVLRVPDFFCPAVSEFLSAHFDVRHYAENPHTLSGALPKVEDGDCVLAVNFFGLFDSEKWARFAEKNKNAILIEDHSHAPFADCALNSLARFCVSSLRKAVPIPAGACMKRRGKSPRLLFLKGRKTLSAYEGKTLSAQNEKRLFIDGANLDAAAAFKSFEDAEAMLSADCESSRISAHSLAIAKNFSADVAAQARLKNMSAFCAEILKSKSAPFEILNLKTIEGAKNARVVFYPVLVFNGAKERDFCRAKMNALGAELPVYWACLPRASKQSAELSKRILCVPLGFRENAELSKEAARLILKAF